MQGIRRNTFGRRLFRLRLSFACWRVSNFGRELILNAEETCSLLIVINELVRFIHGITIFIRELSTAVMLQVFNFLQLTFVLIYWIKEINEQIYSNFNEALRDVISFLDTKEYSFIKNILNVWKSLLFYAIFCCNYLFEKQKRNFIIWGGLCDCY